MSTRTKTYPKRALVAALQAALAAMAAAGDARAADPTVAELTQPTNVVEVGAIGTSSASAKAHEYDGLDRKGVYGNAGFEVRGGGAWDSNDPARWRITGSNLGTQTRNLGAEYGEQGRFRLNFGYDEFLRQRSDSYQTPYIGAGSNALRLPGNWVVPVVPRLSTTAPNARGLSPDVAASPGLVNGVATAPTAAQLAQSNGLIAADVPAFQDVRLSTKRTGYDVGFTLALSAQWELSGGARHEDRTGLKPMGTVVRSSGGDIATIIPDLIKSSTEQVNLGAQYRDEKLFVQGGYYGSFFRNQVGSMSWQNWAQPSFTSTMSSAPSNQFHQLNLTSGYTFTPATRLVGNISWGRSTQNEQFLTDASTPLVPVSSANALIVTKAMNLKLTHRATRALALAANYKFDERDNRTPVNTYGFYDANEAATGASVFSAYFPGVALGANANLNANRAYSRKLNQLNLDADYQISRAQAVKAGFDWQRIDRWCNGAWIDCADASRTTENTVRGEWRTNPTADLNARVGLSHSVRSVNYNENAFLALVPAANLSPTGAPGGATAYGTMAALGLTGYGPVSGLTPAAAPGSAQAFFFANNNALSNTLYGNQNRISELPGMRRYNMADRNRDKLRAVVNWQASEQLSFQGGVDFSRDDYRNSVYGLKRADGIALNVDATWTPSEALSFTAFWTSEDYKSTSAGNTYTANSTAANVNGFTAISGGCYPTIAQRNANNKVDPCLDWSSKNRDRVDTLGLQARHRNLMGGRLDVAGGLLFSSARTTHQMTGGNYVNNPLAVAGAPAGTVAAFYIPASDLPTVKTNVTELRVNARYALSKAQALRFGYSFVFMRTSDYAYEGMQYGGLSGVLPSNEQSPNFRVHTLAVAWQYTWQ